MADQSWISMIAAAGIASVLGHFYQKWVTPRMNFWVINIVFGGTFVLLACLYVLVAFFPYSPPAMWIRELVKP